MAVYYQYQVDIPKEHVTIERQSDGKPALIKYVLSAPYDRSKGYACPKRTIIGHQVIGSVTKMHPTTQYRDIFPVQWEKIANEQVKPSVKSIGMFTAMQAINSKNGIKDILDTVYGINKSGAMVDYAMYSILHNTNAASGFASKMCNTLLYSPDPYSESWYSRLLEKEMTQEMDLLLRKKWALQCREDGVEDVWLCIDGSNDDCQSKGVELAEKGHAKSGKNINIVSFTYAVTNEGKPVTYDVYRGGLVDKKAMKTIIDFLDECGISIRGVILDRGYCDANAIRYLNEKKIAYVIMVKGNPEGYGELIQEYGSKIKMNAQYLIPHTFLFGYQKKVQLFKNYDHEDHVTLFYDYQNGNERVSALLKNLYEEMSRVEKLILSGKTPIIQSKYKSYLTIKTKESAKEYPPAQYIEIVTEALQEALDEKGLYSIVTSQEMTPAQVHGLYSSRNASETEYMLIKSQLGYGKIRVHYTQGVRAKFTLGFITTIIRYEIEQAAKGLDRNTNQMALDLKKLQALKINDVYTYTHVESERQKAFFRNLGSNMEDLLDESVKFENDRISGKVPAPRYRKTGPQIGSNRKQNNGTGEVLPKKSGVAPGTKRGTTNKDGSPRKKPGVPKGTKRSMYNKDGSLRKRPGPKGKETANMG